MNHGLAYGSHLNSNANNAPIRDRMDRDNGHLS